MQMPVAEALHLMPQFDVPAHNPRADGRATAAWSCRRAIMRQSAWQELAYRCCAGGVFR